MTTPASGGRSMSVIICAYTEERWDDVLDAVRSVTAQDVTPHEIIVVVDHNPRLYARTSAALPDVTVVENRQSCGLSGGRNTGVSLATGDVVVFLDDDAVASTDWLRHLGEAYADENVIGVGGLSVPAWDTARPKWFPPEFDWVIGCTFVGRDPGQVRNLLGNNASFRKESFEVAGGFLSDMGRTAAIRRPLGCEETEFCIRVNRLFPRSRLMFDTRPVVRHRVPAPRATFSYFRSRCFAEGLSKAMVTRHVGAAAGLSAERTYAVHALRLGVLAGLGDALRGDLTGLGRAGAIIVGLAQTTVGYLVGTALGTAQDLRGRT